MQKEHGVDLFKDLCFVSFCKDVLVRAGFRKYTVWLYAFSAKKTMDPFCRKKILTDVADIAILMRRSIAVDLEYLEHDKQFHKISKALTDAGAMVFRTK
jgi:hypothetical protein